jgi:phosphatidylglycerophosphatase A
VKPAARITGALAATVLGTGYAPLAPGTAGSIVAAAVYWLVWSASPWWLVLVLAVPVLLLSLWGCIAGYRLWGDDPSRVVADEFAGCWVACLAAPRHWGLAGVAAALVLFRIFDILKPWPVCRLDRLGTPAGILLDDLAAGLMAAALLGLGYLLGGRLL